MPAPAAFDALIVPSRPSIFLLWDFRFTHQMVVTLHDKATALDRDRGGDVGAGVRSA